MRWRYIGWKTPSSRERVWIRGTRIPVELIVRKFSEGAGEDDLLDSYPHLGRDDVRAALAFAADAMFHEQAVPVVSTER